MASIYNQNAEFNGLGTFSVIVPQAGPYFIKGKIMLPTIVGGGGPSSVVTTINQNGSPIYTGVAGAEGFYTTASCAVNDTLAVVFSSSAAADLPLNVIKSSISIGQGQ